MTKMKRAIETIDELRAPGWRVYPCDFVPWEGDDLIPFTRAAGIALRRAQRGWPVLPRVTAHNPQSQRPSIDGPTQEDMK